MKHQANLTQENYELLTTIRFIHQFNREATVGLEQSLVQLSQTLDDLSAHVYDLIKENRNTFTSKERFEAGKYADQLLETKDLILNFHQLIQPLEQSDETPVLEAQLIQEDSFEEEHIFEIHSESKAISTSDEFDIDLDFDEKDLWDFVEVDDFDDLTNVPTLDTPTTNQLVTEPVNQESNFITHSTIWDCDLTSTPKCFKFDGVRTAVSSWSELFEKACQTFYQKNEFKLRSYIGKTAYGNGSINHCYFVVYPNSRRDYFIFESFKHGKLYVERETDAFKIRSLLIKMIHDYGYQTSDFVVYC